MGRRARVLALLSAGVLIAGCKHPAVTGGGDMGMDGGDMATGVGGGGGGGGGADLAMVDMAPMGPIDMRTPRDLTPPPDLGGVLEPNWIDPTGMRNLSDEGIIDWVHWGLYDQNTVTRRAGTPLITAVPIGNAELHQYTENHVSFAWTGGTPTATMAGTTTGIYIMGAGNGFSLTVPAEPTQRTLRVYLSSFGADYRLTAHMSDNSAIDYSDDLSNDVVGTGVYRMYTFRYQSLTPGQTMNVTWVDTYDHFGGSNVTLQAATLH